MAADPRYVLPFGQCSGDSRFEVGGKNTPLGELIARLSGEGVAVPEGFAVTVAAYRRFVHHNGLEAFIRDQMACAGEDGGKLVQAADNVRSAVTAAEMPADVCEEIAAAYENLGAAAGVGDVAVAVSLSATAQDPTEAGVAGREDTLLGIRGAENVVTHCIRCIALLFTDRAMAERTERGPVRGGVRPGIVDTPDELRRRFCLVETQACVLARWVVAIERHFGGPVEMEWALDGAKGGLFVVRARPHSLVRRRSRAEVAEQARRETYGVLAAE